MFLSSGALFSVFFAVSSAAPNSDNSSLSAIFKTSNDYFTEIALQVDSLTSGANSTEKFGQNSSCFREIVNILQAGIQDEWSAKFITANVLQNAITFISNLIREQLSSLGDFDQCLRLNTRSYRNSVNPVPYTGKYCLVHARALDSQFVDASDNQTFNYVEKLTRKWESFRNRVNLVNGICVPSLCSEGEVKFLIEKYFETYLNGIEIAIQNCQEPVPVLSTFLDLSFIVPAFVISTLIGISVSSTFLHWQLSPIKQFTKFCRFLRCFHFIRNLKSLFVGSQILNSKYNLQFLYAIRCFLILYVVVNHCFTFALIRFDSPVAYFVKSCSFLGVEGNSLISGIIETFSERSGFLMDIFFLIGGFIATYATLSKDTPSIGTFWGHLGSRWCRLAPSVAVVMLLYFCFGKLGSGPLFQADLTQPEVTRATGHWWLKILFLNTWFSGPANPATHLWYVEADFQLHLLLYPILLLATRKSQKMCIFLIIFAFMAVAMIALVIATFLGFARLPSFTSRISIDESKLLYTLPVTRLIPYFLGVLLALGLLRWKPKVQDNSLFRDFLICLAFHLQLLCLFSPKPSFLMANSHGSIFYHLFVQLLFSVITCFQLYCLLITKKSLFKTLLNLPIWIALGNLSYGIYLVNLLLIWFNLAQIRQVALQTVLQQLQFILSIYGQSVGLATLLYVFIEMPFRNLAKLIVK